VSDLGKFALSLHPKKTRLIDFGRYAAKNRQRRGLGKPETFDFLGFTLICSQSRRGKFQIKRKSQRDRLPVASSRPSGAKSCTPGLGGKVLAVRGSGVQTRPTQVAVS
jgi:hypothetical protein